MKRDAYTCAQCSYHHSFTDANSFAPTFRCVFWIVRTHGRLKTYCWQCANKFAPDAIVGDSLPLRCTH